MTDLVLKLQLQSGDTPIRILRVLEDHPDQIIYCALPSNWRLMGEVDFLKKIKEIRGKNTEHIHFVTQKPFFIETLKKHGFSVMSDFPDELKETKTEKVKNLLGIISAHKNERPKPNPKTNDTIDTPAEKDTKHRAQFTTRKIENLAREKSWRGVLFFMFVGLIGFLLVLFFFISPRAEIVVKPRIDTIATTQNIIVALDNADIPRTEQNLPRVPAILTETEISDTETFASTRATFEVTNAQGKITLYNEDQAAKFIIPSRLSTDEGLIFRTQQNHTIPGATADGPGSLEVEVIADEYDEQERPIGERGNIANDTDLFFPGFREPLRKRYYAKADRGPLVGGSTLTRYFVDESDVDTSQRIFEESFRVRGLDDLRTEIAERSKREDKDYILLDQPELVQTQLLEFDFPLDLIDQERSTFEASATYKVGGLVFDQDLVLQHLTDKLRLNQDQRKKIVEIDESTIDYRLLDTKFLVEEGWVKISVSLVGVETIDFEADNAFAESWREAIKREVAGRELAQARGVLVNHPEVEEVLSMTISPFWNKVIPTILDQIDLKIRY